MHLHIIFMFFVNEISAVELFYIHLVDSIHVAVELDTQEITS